MFDNERKNEYGYQENPSLDSTQEIPPVKGYEADGNCADPSAQTPPPSAYGANGCQPADPTPPPVNGYEAPNAQNEAPAMEENNCTYHYVRPSLEETKYTGYQAPTYCEPQQAQHQSASSHSYGDYHAADPVDPLPDPPVTPPQEPKAKNKKNKRTYSLASMIAVSLCSALICGVISSSAVVVLGGSLQNNATPSTSQGDTSTLNTNNNKTVYVNETAEANIGTAYEKAAPSVVGIRVSTPSMGNYYFGQESSSSTSEGSGVVYTTDGYIITNYHVISSAVEGTSSSDPFGQQLPAQNTTIEVFLPDNPDEGITATIVGYDASADLAVLKINKTGLTAIEIGNSDEIQVGQKAIAIGNPGGLDFMGSVSSGIISGLNRKIQTEQGVEMNLIQTDAAINPGNSGGALVNINGQLIGINNSKMAGEDFEGMGFAIPVNEVVEICDRLIKNENAPTPYIGITANSSYDAETLQRMGYPAGVVVYSVSVDSPAAEAGIQRNDIITKFNGVEVSSYQMLNSEKAKCSPGDTVTITVYRSGQTLDLQVTLGSAS